MSSTNSPGVQIQEVATLPASVAQVATAVPAFIGYTELNPSGIFRITSMVEYISTFGGPSTETNEQVTVTLSETGDSVSIPSGFSKYTYYAMQLYFANGGGPCYVRSIGNYTSTAAKGHFTGALDALKAVDEPTIIAMPDAVALTASLYGEVVVAGLTHCNAMKDRFLLVDTVASTSASTDSGNLRNNIGNQYLKYGAAYYPYLSTTPTFDDAVVQISGASGNSLDGFSIEEIKAGDTDIDPDDYAKYKGRIATALASAILNVPPSAAIAGIYCSVDRDRGVWKAPANVSVAGTSGPAIKLTEDEGGALNVNTTSGKSINAIRKFTGKGTLVWGARTLAGNDNEWKYIPVRRLFITAEESIKKATQFVVFEPNDANTWTRTKAMIENYLNGLWRQGALAGATPEDAFFVNVGLGETMTAQDILEGKLIIEIGMAAVRPAEFITLRFSHKLQEA